MNSKFEPEPHYRELHHRLNDVFTPTYLTILSIIQAVALTDLAVVVAAEYQHFTVVNWLLALLTFSVLIIVWNVYTIQGTLWSWIPDVRDAAMPFVVGGIELFLDHAIIHGMSVGCWAWQESQRWGLQEHGICIGEREQRTGTFSYLAI